jgi:hypothetical protein
MAIKKLRCDPMKNSKLRNFPSAPWFALIVIALAVFVIYSGGYLPAI